MVGAMSRRARKEQRLRGEQDSVGTQRAERQEQEALAGKAKLAASLSREQRLVKVRESEAEHPPRPRRVARPGKPLKR